MAGKVKRSIPVELIPRVASAQSQKEIADLLSMPACSVNRLMKAHGLPVPNWRTFKRTSTRLVSCSKCGSNVQVRHAKHPDRDQSRWECFRCPVECACGCAQRMPPSNARVYGRKGFIYGHYGRNELKSKLSRDGLRKCTECHAWRPATTEFFAVSTYSYRSDGLRAKCKSCAGRKTAESNLAQKLEMIAAYGGSCSCCGETRHEFLTLEHSNHDGGRHRRDLNGSGTAVWRDLKRRGWPREGFTVFCWNCQLATKLGQPCPHFVERVESACMELLIND